MEKNTKKIAAAERQCRVQTIGAPQTEAKPNSNLAKVSDLILLSTEWFPNDFDSYSMHKFTYMLSYTIIK